MRRLVQWFSFAGQISAERVVLSVVVGLMTVTAAQANSPCVQFDVVSSAYAVPMPQAFECDLTDRDGSVEWVEVILPVSTLLRFGQEDQVQQMLFVVESPTRSMTVVDFAPKTALTTSYAGNIERTAERDHSSSAGLNANLSPVDFATAQANASTGAKQSESTRYQTLPPMELLTASGTAGRGSAVYFKFRSTPQTTLEGKRELRVVFQVPSAWRADYVYVRCAAFDQAALQQHSGPICGSADFLVPLYRVGDDEARAAALAFGDAEYRLRESARTTAVRMAGKSESTWTKTFNHVFHTGHAPTTAVVPPQWLSQVLTSQPNQREFTFQAALPRGLQNHVQRFTEARWQLAQLNPRPTTEGADDHGQLVDLRKP